MVEEIICKISCANQQGTWGLDVTLKAKLFLLIILRHVRTGCNVKDKVVLLYTINAHGDWV
jgi:hypothetical protein